MASSDASVSKEDAPKKTRIISEEEREKIDERRQVTDFFVTIFELISCNENYIIVIRLVKTRNQS